MNVEKDTTVASGGLKGRRKQSQGTGISPWACYQCKKSNKTDGNDPFPDLTIGEKSNGRSDSAKWNTSTADDDMTISCNYDSDKLTPSCGICLRNAQDCHYPLTAQKPGPKLGSYHKCKASASYRRYQSSNPPFPPPSKRYPASEGSDSEHVPLHHLLAHESKSNGVSSWILHHFHEKQGYHEDIEENRKNSLSPQIFSLSTPHRATQQSNITYICAALEISEDDLIELTDLFFSDLTSISLFHRPTFHQRIYNELDPEESTALLASMFSLSARHFSRDKMHSRSHAIKPSRFYEIASNLVHKQLRNCGDQHPPLVVLQTFIMTTYYELVSGVRGVAWRSLGAVIRIAYEFRLHLVDLALRLSSTYIDSDPVEVWTDKEEKRRAWWTIWEFEVFATTIRKCPLGMDPKQHATLLPVDNASWFNGQKTSSCFFEADPVLRWKKLKESDNESGRAWFIVINSFMRDAHSLSNASVPVESSSRDEAIHFGSHFSTSKVDDSQDFGMASKLAVLDNCVSCFNMALPQQLRYRSELLFSSSSNHDRCHVRRRDSEKQTIHAMIHLAKIMILHKDCFRNNHRDHERQDDLAFYASKESSTWLNEISSRSNLVWPRYLDAAENVVRIGRNSSMDHIRYGDPLLVNTFWIVAAIQLVQSIFAKTKSEKLMAQSNFDLLRLTLIQYEQYWNTSSVLVPNLEKLQSTLSSIRAHITSRSSLINQPSATSTSPEQQFIPIVAQDVLKENRHDITADNTHQVDILSDERLFTLDNSDSVCSTNFDGLNLDFALDLPIDTIFFEIWQNSQFNELYTDSDILEP